MPYASVFVRVLVRQAKYLSGNMTNALTFRYVVIEGDHTDAFDFLDTRTAKRQRFSTALVRPPAAEVRSKGQTCVCTRRKMMSNTLVRIDEAR